MPALKYVKTARETQNVYKFGKTFIHIQTLKKVNMKKITNLVYNKITNNYIYIYT